MKNTVINDIGKEGCYDDPNRFARPLEIEEYDESIVIHGYQEYVLTKDTLSVIDIDNQLKRKRYVLEKYFTKNYLYDRSFLDIGSNAGFFSFWALQNGAKEVFSLYIDDKYQNVIRMCCDKFGFTGINTVKTNITEWKEPTDIVLALALIHWIYSCTATYGSIDAAIKKLSDLTNYMLIIEWIDPEDPAIQSFQHNRWNESKIREPYSFNCFGKALNKYFDQWEYIGEVSSTRRIFLAYKTKSFIDLSFPFVPVRPKECLISSKNLTVINGEDYWSCVYDDNNKIVKQTTNNLAEREGRIVSRLKSDYFPKIYDFWVKDAYSVVVMEKIDGNLLRDSVETIRSDSASIYNFILHCLDILEELENEKIMHRDIRLDNLMFREGKPVLIDFGWAEIFDENILSIPTPSLLGGSGKPPDGVFCDKYSMGKVIEKINQGKFEQVTIFSKLMCIEDSSLRILNTDVLRNILRILQYEVQKNFLELKPRVMNQFKYCNQPVSLDCQQNSIYQIIIECEKKIETEFEKKYKELAEKHEELTEKYESMNTKLSHEISELKNEVCKYALSKSWIITRPLRKIMKILKRE